MEGCKHPTKPRQLQAKRFRVLYGLSPERAALLASIVFGEAMQ